MEKFEVSRTGPSGFCESRTPFGIGDEKQPVLPGGDSCRS